MLMCEKITLFMAMWMVLIFIVTINLKFEIFFILIFIGLLGIKFFTDLYSFKKFKLRINILIVIFFIAFLLLAATKVINFFNL